MKYLEVVKTIDEQMKLYDKTELYNLQLKMEYRVPVEKDLASILYDEFVVSGKRNFKYKNHTYQINSCKYKTSDNEKIYIINQDNKKEPHTLFRHSGEYWLASSSVGIKYTEDIIVDKILNVADLFKNA